MLTLAALAARMDYCWRRGWAATVEVLMALRRLAPAPA